MKKDPFKKSALFLSILFIFLIILVIALEQDNKKLLASNNTSLNSNALTMMLETDINSNQYEAATSNDWPESGFIFNAEMSGCERGGTLSWNNETNKVVMESLDPDKCYVYFDRYNGANITINKDGSFVGCINIDNSNAVVDVTNNGNMSLTCDSHVTTFVDTNNYSNILSNGYNIYYDQNYNPELNGETIPLNGGGYLLPN